MERIIFSLLLIWTSLVTAPFNVTRRENGDRFVWKRSSSHDLNCNAFTKGTAWYHDGACQCNTNDMFGGNLGTFSTENHHCESYTTGVDEGKEL